MNSSSSNLPQSSQGGGLGRGDKGVKPCRFGTKCRNFNCRFGHSTEEGFHTKEKDKDQADTQSSNTNKARRKISRKPCKFGNQCTRRDCWFVHPTGNQQQSTPSQQPQPLQSNIVITTSYEIPGVSTTTTTTNTTPEIGKPYQFCSRQECFERQELGQVSSFEATIETALLSQNQRQLDPTLAVAKYRRSAAGTYHDKIQYPSKEKERLELLLDHLLRIASTGRPTSEHTMMVVQTENDTSSFLPWTEFLVDRLRACQADATRLSSSSTRLSSTWHAKMVRILIWIMYWMPWRQSDKIFEQILSTMFATAMDHYWFTTTTATTTTTTVPAAKESELSSAKVDGLNHQKLALDDEMLCYAALHRLSKRQQQQQSDIASGNTSNDSHNTTMNGILLDYTRHIPPSTITTTTTPRDYPFFQQALQFTAQILRDEYYGIIQNGTNQSSLPILARCCLAKSLSLWRYKQCQQYNISFAKEEGVTDLDRLLNIISVDTWTPTYVKRLVGLPCRTIEDDDNHDDHDHDHDNRDNDELKPASNKFSVVFKKVPMPDESSSIHKRPTDIVKGQEDPWYEQDNVWTFGCLYDKNRGNMFGLLEEHVIHLLQTGWSTMD